MSVRRRFPAIPGDLGHGTIRKLKELAEIWSGDRGNPLDRVVTFRDLEDADIGRLNRSNGSLDLGEAVSGGTEIIHMGPLENLEAAGAVHNIILNWEGTNQRGFAYVEVWRSEDANLANAVLVGTSRGRLFTDPVGPGSEYCYWVRAVSVTDTPGPYNQTEGTCAETAPDVDRLLDVLEGQLSESQLVEDLRSSIELIDKPETGLVERLDQIASTVGDTSGLDNMLYDGSLERVENDCSPGWGYCSSGSGVSSLFARSHGYAVRLDAHAISPTSYRYNHAINPERFDADGGEAFRVRGWYYLSQDAVTRDQVGPAAIAINQFNTGNQNVGSKIAYGMETSRGVWHRIDAVLRMDTGLTIGSGRFEVRSYLDAGQVYFDDLELYRGSDMPEEGTSILERLAQVEPTRASYSVKTDVNGRVTGYGFAADSDSSEFAIIADRFTIAAPDSDDQGEAPFYHRTTWEQINGEWVPPGTYIEQGFIADGTIIRAKLGDAAIDTAKIAQGAIESYTLGDGVITSAKIADYLQSDNWQPGQSGWKIWRSGDVEFNDGVFRGNLSVGTLDIQGNAVTVPLYTQADFNVINEPEGPWVERLVSPILNLNVSAEVMVWVMVKGIAEGESTNVAVRFRVNGNAFYETTTSALKALTTSHIFTSSVYVGAGSDHRLQLDIRNDWYKGNFRLREAAMTVLAVKR